MKYLFECQECEQEVEIECKLAEKDERSCPLCDAPPEKMKQLVNTRFYPHVSWSQWKV